MIENNTSIPIIGIAGGSGSGKTALVNEFIKQFPQTVSLISLDWYYSDLSHCSLEERWRVNFDCPDALDTTLFLEQLNSLASGKSVLAPLYDYPSHCRTGTQLIRSEELILVEGIMLFAIPEVIPFLRGKVFMDTPGDIRLLRRIQRDYAERGRSLESISQQYVKTVRPMYYKYILPSRIYADLILDGLKPLDCLVQELIEYLCGLHILKSTG